MLTARRGASIILRMRSSTQLAKPTRVWVAAMRPRTLPLAIASIVLGTAVAAAHGFFSWPVFALSVITAVLLQILSNLANDYGDSRHGADHAERLGPRRAVQSGLLSAAQMRRAMAICAALAMASGLALLVVAFGFGLYFWLFVLLGAAAIGAAIAYTNGKRPYGYAGLGDIAVLIFFGWVGVLGPYFLQTQRLDWLVLLPATSCGLLAVAVLNVNNIRDVESDRKAGKQSIPVRLGPRKARIYHWALLAGATLLALLYIIVGAASPQRFLFLLAVPLLARHGLAVWRTDDPRALNPMLKQLSLTTLLFVLLFSLGQVL